MMIIKRLIVAFFALVLLAVAGLYVTGNGFIITGIQRTYLVGNVTANINDHTVFKVREITTGEAQTLPQHANYNSRALADDFRATLNESGTAAYLVVKDGQVVAEHYFNGYGNRSKTNSFSMAKTVTTMLLGIAIGEGLVESLEQPLTDFLPEFANDPLGSKATIGQLSLMTSGYEWTEHYYSPFSPTVQLLYGSNVEAFLLDGHFSAEPGTFFEYSSASAQLLGIALTRALKKSGTAENVSEYLSRKIWQPLQMNDNALWHLDNSGMELVFCCINTNARNFAKLGMLMLNKGRWNGQQLIPADFVQTMITPVVAPHYGYSIWLSPNTTPSYFWFSGHLGQYIINLPEHNMVVLRLGETRSSNKAFIKEDLPVLVKQALALSEG